MHRKYSTSPPIASCKSRALSPNQPLKIPMLYPQQQAPPVARVKQYLPPEHIEDPERELYERLMAGGLREKISRGARIAITAGSRGMGGMIEMLRAIVQGVRDAGGEPFIVPAMGSHGGAVAEGQAEILRRLGVTGNSVGAPVHATMETVELGTADNGAIAHLDRRAAEADGIIVLGRVKTHPESSEGLASGLLKMVTIGLGKQHGAREAHRHGLWESVRSVPKLHLQKSRIICGVAVVENAGRHPLVIEVVPPYYNAFLDADVRLLKTARAHLAELPVRNLDVLVVDEIGKNISGAGMDPNIVGHWRISGGSHVPDYSRIVVLSLSSPSLGNGIGIGMADFTTQRFVQAFDPEVTGINVLTATEADSNPREASLPLVLANDREAIETALYSALAGERPRLCRIRNTGDLDEFWVSEALLDEVREYPRLSIEEEPAPMKFDGRGNLIP